MASSEETTKQNILDDVIIIWLDESITNPAKQFLSERKNLFLSCVKSIRPFLDTKNCYEYIQKISGVRILFIVSGSLGEIFVPTIHDLSQIVYIYVFCFDTNRHESWTKQLNKIRRVFNDSTSLSIRLKDDLRSLTETILPFGLFDSAQRSLKDLTSEQASFMWFQLIIEVLLRLPQTPEARTEMVVECRSNYKENEQQLENIEMFEKTYQANEAIKWYTENSFVFQLFNKAFRKQDSEVIFKYRYFLVDLSKQIETLYNQQYKDQQGNLTVYRGQVMFKSELMKLKQSIDHLISINTFFSTSVYCIVASSFSGNSEYESQGIVSVIFQITVDHTIQSRPFAKIDHLSAIKDEGEILFSIGTVFRVEHVDLESDTICYVKLTWDKEANEKLKEMKRLTGLIDFYIDQHIGDHPSVLTFGFFLSEMGHLRQALRFYIYLRKTLSKDHPDRRVLHNNLGEVLRKLNYFNLARHEFEESLEYCSDTISIYHPFFAILHSNIALLNLTCGKPKEALKFYRCASLILSRNNTQNDSKNSIYIEKALAIVYHGMGSVSIVLKKIQNAIDCHEKALKIESRLLPSDHPALIESYYDLGNLYVKLKKLTKALEYYEKALNIAQLNLLVKDQRYILLHVSIAVVTFYIDQNASKTLMHCSHALEIMEEISFAPSSSSHLYVYKMLAIMYFQLNLLPLAGQMWGRFIKERNQQLETHINNVDLSEMLWQVNALKSSEPDLNQTSIYTVFIDDRSSSIATMSHQAAIDLCEFADECRAMGYIKYAIRCYLWSLEHHPVSDNHHFDHIHKSRIHNNLGACYQDMNDNDEALYHYQSSLDISIAMSTQQPMHIAIIHYNIALIYIEKNELNNARKHLNQSLSHFWKQSTDTSSILNVQIYIALIEIYRQWNDWHMVRNYYERIIDQCKQDSANPSVIQRYEKYLQDTIDKINVNLNIP